MNADFMMQRPMTPQSAHKPSRQRQKPDLSCAVANGMEKGRRIAAVCCLAAAYFGVDSILHGSLAIMASVSAILTAAVSAVLLYKNGAAFRAHHLVLLAAVLLCGAGMSIVSSGVTKLAALFSLFDSAAVLVLSGVPPVSKRRRQCTRLLRYDLCLVCDAVCRIFRPHCRIVLPGQKKEGKKRASGSLDAGGPSGCYSDYGCRGMAFAARRRAVQQNHEGDSGGLVEVFKGFPAFRTGRRSVCKRTVFCAGCEPFLLFPA